MIHTPCVYIFIIDETELNIHTLEALRVTYLFGMDFRFIISTYIVHIWSREGSLKRFH